MKYNGGNYALLDYIIYLPFILLFIGILIYFYSLRNKEGLGSIVGLGYSIDNIGVSTTVKRSG